MVSGHYKNKFPEASHILFEGHLDDPNFRSFAIQKITGISDGVVKTDKGDFKIRKRRAGKKEEFVTTEYRTFFWREHHNNRASV